MSRTPLAFRLLAHIYRKPMFKGSRARSARPSAFGAMRSWPGCSFPGQKGQRMVEAHEPVVAACPEASREDIQHREDALDEALAESFPASDPPAMVRPARRSDLCARQAASSSQLVTGQASSSNPSPAAPTAERNPDRSEDRHFPEVLQELTPLLDHPPATGSVEHPRFLQLIAEVGRHGAMGAQHPYAEQLGALSARIDAITQRRDEEQHAHDLAPGGQPMSPMLGLDFRGR
jgi:hypothetical protein